MRGWTHSSWLIKNCLFFFEAGESQGEVTICGSREDRGAGMDREIPVYRIFRTITHTTDNPHPPCFCHKKKQKLTDYLHRHITRTPIHSFLPRISSH